MTTGDYLGTEPKRAEFDSLPGPVVVEFGAPWCGICRGAQGVINAALAQRPDVPRFRVEDGPGRPLGRSFKVKLWPTLVFLNHGVEVARVVRPSGEGEIAAALARIAETV